MGVKESITDLSILKWSVFLYDKNNNNASVLIVYFTGKKELK